DVEQCATRRRNAEPLDGCILELAHDSLRIVAVGPEPIALAGGQLAHACSPLAAKGCGARKCPYACVSSGTRCARRRTVRSSPGFAKSPASHRRRASRLPSVLPHDAVRTSCTEGKRLFSTS